MDVLKGRWMKLRTLNRADWMEIHDLLLDRSRILEIDLAGLENETTGQHAERAGAESSALGDFAELASDASEKAVMYGQIESQSGELVEVRDALERLEKGSFGLCGNCGVAIPLERLRAIPYARLCMICKSAEERA